MKRCLSVLLSICLILGTLTAFSVSASAFTSGECGDELAWGYNSSDHSLKFSGYGGMTDWTSPDDVPWKEYRDQIETISICRDMTSIGDYAFYGCTALRYVYFYGITLSDIGRYAFSGCTAMTSAHMPKFIKTVSDYAFSGCTALSDVTIPLTAQVSETAFDGCEKLDIAPGSVYACGKCGKKARYTVTKDGALSITGTGALYDFEDDECGGDPPSTAKYCPWYDLYRKDIIKATVAEGITDVGSYTFEYCENLSEVSLPESVVSIGDGAFVGCSSLGEISIPNSVAKIGERAFESCSSLSAVRLPDSLSKLGYDAFRSCSSLKKFRVSQNNVYYTADDSGLLLSKDKTVLCCVPGGFEGVLNVPEGVVTIGSSAAVKCGFLTGIVFSDSVEDIRSAAFSYCSSITELILPDSVRYIRSGAFMRCEELQNLEIGKGVKSIETSAFSDCAKLTSVIIPENVTSLSGFDGCSSLTLLTVLNPNCSVPNYTGNLGVKGKTVIYGYPKSSVHTYCLKYGYSFVPFGDIDAPTLKAGNDAATGKVVLGWQNGYDKWDRCDIYAASSKSGPFAKVSYTYGISWTDNSLKTGETRYYYVEGICGTKTAKSAVVIRTCDLTPTAVTATNDKDTGKVVLNWKYVSGATGFRVYRAESEKGSFKAIDTTSSAVYRYTDTSAKAGKTYYYKVIALGKTSASDSAASNIVSRACRLNKPVITVSNDPKTGKVVLKWKAVSGAKGYRVYRAESKSGAFKAMKVTTSTSYTNTSAKAGKTYYYRVVALGKTAAANSLPSAIKSRACDLAKPVVTAKRNSSGHPRLTWNAVGKKSGYTGLVAYEIYRSTSKNSGYKLIGITSNLRFTNSSAKAGKTYYYKVKAVMSKSSANSAYSAVVSVKAK